MLIAIRERAKGWVAWLLVLAIVVPLAFFGVYNYVQGPPASEVAVVNDTTITSDQISRAVQEQRQRLEQLFGGQLDPALFDEKQMRQEALDSLIDQALLREFVQKQGLRISDDTLAAIIFSEQAFQENGKFSPERYQLLLRSNGLTPQAYEASVRLGQAIEQLQGGVYASAFATDAEVRRLLDLQRQERNLTYLTVKAQNLREQVSVTDDEVQRFYEQNAQLFQRPEQVKLAYVELSRDALAKQVNIPEDELRARYEQVKDTRFSTGGERKVRHILLDLPSDATAEQEEKARATLRDLREQIQSGKLSFEAAAKQYSKDPGSAQAGGDLGVVTRGQMVEEFEKAAFALEEGQLSEPVRSPFGLHLIQVTEVTPKQVQSFEQVRDQLRQDMVAERLDNQLVELGNRLANLAYEHPDSLAPVAEQLGLQVQQTGWITRADGGEGIGANEKVRQAAFEEEVLREGRNSDVIALDDGRQLVVRVQEHQPAEQRPLQEVAGQVREQLTQQKAAAAAQELGEELREGLEAGQAPQQLARQNAVELQQPGFVGRAAEQVPAPVLREAFQLPKPAQGKSSVGTARLPAGDYVVLQVSDVRQPAAGEDEAPAVEAAEDQLQALHGNAAVRGLLQALREKADLEIRKDRL